MTISAIADNLGLVTVSISPRTDTPTIAAQRKKTVPRRGRIKAFTAKSRRRFREQLATAAIPWNRSAVLTLNFPLGTAPKAAKAEIAAFARLAKKRLPGAFGWHSVEWKSSGMLHLHVLLCAPRHAMCDVMSLRMEFAAKFPVAYMAPMFSLRGWLDYLSKHDRQRTPPPEFAGQLVRYWGSFGRVPKLPGRRVSLPDSAQSSVRNAVAGLVAKQGSERSYGFACAVAASTGRVSVKLSRVQAAQLMNPLIVTFGRVSGRGPGMQIPAKSTKVEKSSLVSQRVTQVLRKRGITTAKTLVTAFDRRP